MLNLLRVFFYTGWRRQLAVIIALLSGSLAENLSVATLWPIISMITDKKAQSNNQFIGRVVTDILGYLHLPVTLGVLLSFMIIFVGLKFALSMTGMVFVGREVANVATSFRLRMIDAILHAKWGYFTAQPSGRFTAAISIESDRASNAFKMSGTVLAKLMECTGYIICGFFISWQFSVGTIISVAILWVAVTRFIRIAKKAGRGKSKYYQRLASSISEIMLNIKALKAMNRHHHLAEIFDADIRKLRAVLQKDTYSNAAILAMQEPILAILCLTGIYMGFTYLGLGLQSLIATLWLLRRIAMNIGDMRQGMQTIAIDSPAFWATVKVIDELKEEVEQLRAGQSVSLTKTASFNNVSFSYPTRDVMQNVSLDIRCGDVTTIIGPSGAGKTTIADILVGLNKPSKGDVLIDNVPLSQIDLKAWRHRIGYIPQDNILFDDSIATNVTLGDQTISKEQVENALKLAGAWNFISKLPDGIDQKVGVRGNLLSGGQKQRLSIARALIGNPDLLILDEATSALDHDTAREICESVRQLADNRTILAITHQALWIDAADRIYEMQNGNVTQVAAHSA